MTDAEAIQSLLREFFAAMRQYELVCSRRDKQVGRDELAVDEYEARNSQELQDIFRRYCTTWESPRRGASFTLGSSYDPDGEKILETTIEGDNATVRTQQTTTSPALSCVYTLRNGADGWRIVDNRSRVRPAGGLASWPL